MSKKPMNPRDLETLSAYLDDALNPRESTRLETRLAKDAELRQELAALRHTRAVLRAAPQARAPRNFTLTPQMVGASRQRFSLVGSFRFVSVLASFMFIALFASDLWLVSTQPFAASEPAAIFMEEENTEAMAVEAPAASAEIYTPKSGEAPLPAAAPTEAVSVAANEASQEEPVEQGDTADTAADASSSEEGEAAEPENAIVDEDSLPTATLTHSGDEGIGGGASDDDADADLERALPPTTDESTLTPIPSPTSSPAFVQNPPSSQSGLRLAAYVMALVALIAGALAWWLRRH